MIKENKRELDFKKTKNFILKKNNQKKNQCFNKFQHNMSAAIDVTNIAKCRL